MLKSPKTKTLAEGLTERTSSMLDEIESKTMDKDEEGEWSKASKKHKSAEFSRDKSCTKGNPSLT